MSPPPLRRILALVVLLLGSQACIARHVMPPPRPVMAANPAQMRQVNLYLRSFEITGLSKRDRRIDVEHLQDALLDYVEAKTDLRSAQFNLSGRRRTAPPFLDLNVTIELERENNRTWVLDVLNVYPFVGILPLVPWWGHVQLVLNATIQKPDGTIVGEYWHGVQVPFSAFTFAWYRRDYVEKAYRRAYLEVFRELAADIARDGAKLDALARGIEPPSDDALGALASGPDTLSDLPDPIGFMDELPTPDGAEASAGMPEPGESDYFYVPQQVEQTGDDAMKVLPHEGFHVITGAELPPFAAGWLSALKLLGGVEVATFKGRAHVSSRALDGDGNRVIAASGDATQSGWRVSLYSAPESTGFFFYPTLGYMQQKIGNVDIRSDLENLNTIDIAEGDIPALASDPDTGAAVDPGTANVYHLDMRSAYGGVRSGLDLVAGNDSFVFFASATVGVNLGEYRQITAELDECGSDVDPAKCLADRNGFDFLNSGAAGGTIGFKLPKIHAAVRLIFDYEFYRKFRYSRSLAVRGPATLDPRDGKYKHPELRMRAASLSAWNFQIAGAMVF